MAVSGKNGSVLVGASAVTEVTKWTFEGSAQIHKFATNATSGYKAGVAGPTDGKGTIETKVASDVIWKPGTAVTLILQGATSGDTITCPALIGSCSIETDIDTGNAISATYNFETNGAWTGAGIFAAID
jgi:hypothetical protein